MVAREAEAEATWRADLTFPKTRIKVKRRPRVRVCGWIRHDDVVLWAKGSWDE